jgi:hypothetical protein
MPMPTFLMLKERDESCSFCNESADFQLRWEEKDQEKGSYQFFFLCDSHRRDLGSEVYFKSKKD